MHPDEREKIMFVSPDGLFEFDIMPFIISNASATFEQFVDTILHGLKWHNSMCYLDDVIIYSRGFEEDNERPEIVLNRIQETGLIFRSELASFRDGLYHTPEVAVHAALAQRVWAAADSGIGCSSARVVMDVSGVTFMLNGKGRNIARLPKIRSC